MENEVGNSNRVPPVPPNIEFLNEKERREWVNFLKLGGVSGLFGGVIEWNFGGIIRQ